MAKISGKLKETDNHSGDQPQLLGSLTIDGKTTPVAGWVFYNADGTITVSIADTRPVPEESGE